MKNPKGSVVVDSLKGMLRLRFPRYLFGGKQKYLSLGLPDTPLNRQAAEAKALAIASDIAFDRFDPTLERYRPTSIRQETISPSLRELWDKYSLEKGRYLAVSTIDKDFKRVRNHLSEMPFYKLSEARQIRKHLMQSKSLETAKKVLMQINACCQWALEEGIISENPFSSLPRVRSGKKKKSIEPFTKHEADLIVAAFESHPTHRHYYRFVKFLFLTGCRTSEAIALRWKHIYMRTEDEFILFEEAFVQGNRKGTKTGLTRKFPINDQLEILLAEHQLLTQDWQNLPPENLVFTSPEGYPIDAHNFLNRAWKDCLKTLAIVYRPQYNTRHTFISRCLESGVPVAQVAQWVGNSSTTIWNHYAGVISKAEVPIL